MRAFNVMTERAREGDQLHVSVADTGSPACPPLLLAMALSPGELVQSGHAPVTLGRFDAVAPQASSEARAPAQLRGRFLTVGTRR